MAKKIKLPIAEEPDEPKDEVEARLQMLDNAEQAIDAAFMSGKADRAAITEKARDDANEAVRKTEIAMEYDAEADEAGRLAIIAENMGDPEKTRNARRHAREARREAKHAHRSATKTAKEAYDAIKFSQPGKLGFMRVVMVVYAFNIASVLFALLLTSRDTITYDSVTILDWITIILQGVGLWFFINYFKITKKYVIATSAFGIVAHIVVTLAMGKFSVPEFLFSNVWNIFLLIYFSFSKRVDKVMVNDFSSFRPKRDTFKINRRGWPFIRNLIIYFVIFSILGHWMEAGLCQFIRLGIVQGEYDPTNTMLWRDWLYPYPMEGAAVVIIALVLYPLWQFLLKKFEKPIYAYIVSFIANALTCSVIEFSMGLIVNSNHQLWDYREMPFNIMGQVCLQNTLAFGVAASLIAWVVYPMLERWLSRIPNDTMNIVFVVVAVIGGILWSLYIIDPPESHELTPEAIEQQEIEEERVRYRDVAAGIEGSAEALQAILNSSEHLSQQERDKVQAQIDKIKEDVKLIDEAGNSEKADASKSDSATTDATAANPASSSAAADSGAEGSTASDSGAEGFPASDSGAEGSPEAGPGTTDSETTDMAA